MIILTFNTHNTTHVSGVCSLHYLPVHIRGSAYSHNLYTLSAERMPVVIRCTLSKNFNANYFCQFFFLFLLISIIHCLNFNIQIFSYFSIMVAFRNSFSFLQYTFTISLHCIQSLQQKWSYLYMLVPHRCCQHCGNRIPLGSSWKFLLWGASDRVGTS